MKIGILTLPLHTNYGGILQAFALQRFLGDQGYNSEIIKLNRIELFLKYKIKIIIKNVIKKYLLRRNIDNVWQIISHDEVKQFSTQIFIDKYLIQTIDILPNKDELKKYCTDNFDAVIVGSDQVWRKQYIKKSWTFFFLNFKGEKRMRKIAYAASFGLDDWQYSFFQTMKIKHWLKDFSKISVREESGAKLFKEKLSITAEVMIDPTMLLNTKVYRELIDENLTKFTSKELTAYILDENEHKRNMVDIVSNNLGFSYQIIKLCNNGNVFFSIPDWLKAFSDAKYVLTDSFHGTVFSILFNKPFLVIANKNRGLTRFISLLKIFDLTDRLIYEDQIVTKEMIVEDIDWSSVNNIIEQKRNEAYIFLRESIE